jgi:hypothetical protein
MIKFTFLEVENKPYLYGANIYKDKKKVGVLNYFDEDGILEVTIGDIEQTFMLGFDEDDKIEAYFKDLMDKGFVFGHYKNKKFVSEVRVE